MLCFSALCAYCDWLIRHANVIALDDEKSNKVNIHRIICISSLLLAFIAIIMIVVCFIADLDIKFGFLCMQYLSFFIVRVLMFMLVTKFSPGFKIKSVIRSNDKVDIIGLNLKGIEIFKY